MIKITFEKPDMAISISSVEIIWNTHELENTEMHKERLEDKWIAEADISSKGTYTYRFLINGLFTLNDPNANMFQPDSEGKLWSAIVIDEQGRQLFNNEQYSVNIESVQIADDYYDDKNESQYEFATTNTNHIVTRYEFTNVTGVHTASVLWLNPNGEISAWAEEAILPTNESSYAWFGLDTINMDSNSAGIWNILLFIDGKYVFAHTFTIIYETRKVTSGFDVTI